MAVGFTAIGLIGSIGGYLDPTAKSEPSLASLVGFYFIAGACGGLLLGLFRPVTKYKVGAVVVGTAVVAISLGLLDYMYVATDGWKPVDTILVALVSVVAGPAGTLMIWHLRAQRGKSPSDSPDLKQ
jgi:hypothetical protein